MAGRSEGSWTLSSLCARFAVLAGRAPSAPAVVGPGGEVLRTRADLEAEAGLLADRLAEAGCDGGLVGVAAGNAASFPAVVLAAWRSGCVPVLLEGGMPPAELEAVAEALGMPWVVEDAAGGPRALGGAGDCGPLPTGAALVKLSSGSTGRPRGILATADNVAAEGRILCRAFGLGEGTRSLGLLPLSHSYGFGNLVLPLLLEGAVLVLGSPFEPRRALREMAAGAAEVVPAVPLMFDLWSRLADPPPLGDGVRLLLSAGSLLAASIQDRFRSVFGRPVARFYGTSETGPIAFDPGDEDPGTEAAAGPAVGALPVGWPMPEVEVRLVGEQGEEVREGPGRVEVRSPAVAACYRTAFGAQEEGAQGGPVLGGGRFLADDLARLDGLGRLVLQGRVSRRIHVAGRKVQPEEVEEVLRGLPGVREALVVGLPRGEATEEVGALVEGGAGLSEEALRRACALRLSSHKVPRRILLVPCLPRTARGKMDVAAARAWFSAWPVSPSP